MGFCPARFGVLFCRYTLFNYWTVQSVVPGSYQGCVFEFDIVHRRSVVVLCMLYKIRWNPMHQLNVALPGSCVPVPVTRGAKVAASLQNLAFLQDFCYLSVSLWNDLADPYSMVWDWLVSREGPMFFYWPKHLYPFCSFLLFFPFSSFCQLVGIVGLGSED